MWKPKLQQAGFNLNCPDGRPSPRRGSHMACRRRVARGRFTLAGLAVAVLAVLFGASVSVSNSVISLRMRIAHNEEKREFLEAEAARLEQEWTVVSDPDVVRERAYLEIGLVDQPRPELVLVRQRPESVTPGARLRRALSEWTGASEARAATRYGSMVSATPRAEPAMSGPTDGTAGGN